MAWTPRDELDRLAEERARRDREQVTERPHRDEEVGRAGRCSSCDVALTAAGCANPRCPRLRALVAEIVDRAHTSSEGSP